MKQFVLLIYILFMVTACGNDEHDHDHDHDHNGDHDHQEHMHDGDEHQHEDGDEHQHEDGDEHQHEDGDEHQHEDGDDHDHDHSALSIDKYSGKTGLYLEYEPLVVGKRSDLAAHLTRLSDFSPVRTGSLEVIFSAGGHRHTYNVKEAASPGIFRFGVEPQSSGRASMQFILRNEELTDTINIDNIAIYKDAHDAPAPSEPGPDEVAFTLEQAWDIDFAIGEVISKPFRRAARCSGEALPSQTEESKVVARTEGVVSFVRRNLLSGTNVSRGQDLFAISGGDFAEGNIRQRYQAAKTAFAKAKADFERAEKLLEKNAISEKKFLDYKLTFESAELDYLTISKNFTEKGVRIESPISGYINRIMVNEGDYVRAGEPLAVVSKNNRLTVRADLDQSHFDIAGTVTGAKLYLPYKNKYYDLEEMGGRVVSVGQSLENGATIPIYLELPNNGDFLPGAFLSIDLLGKATERSIVVPRSALLEQEGAYYVYIQTSGEAYRRTEVFPEASVGDEVKIGRGLSEGQRIVTRGAYRLMLASQKSALPSHGHVH
ncbi:MAG: efflux RND transporter periplasmic adaptor subunit [Candidatus Kapaibacterium sp.]